MLLATVIFFLFLTTQKVAFFRYKQHTQTHVQAGGSPMFISQGRIHINFDVARLRQLVSESVHLYYIQQ